MTLQVYLVGFSKKSGVHMQILDMWWLNIELYTFRFKKTITGMIQIRKIPFFKVSNISQKEEIILMRKKSKSIVHVLRMEH